MIDYNQKAVNWTDDEAQSLQLIVYNMQNAFF